MTRKRFTKLLMAGGCSPRAVQAWVEGVQAARLPYSELFNNLDRAGGVQVKQFCRIVNAAVVVAVEIVKIIAEVLKYFFEFIGEMLVAIGEWCRDIFT